MYSDLLNRLTAAAGSDGGVTYADVRAALGLTHKQVRTRLAEVATIGTRAPRSHVGIGRPQNLYAPEAVAGALVARLAARL